MPPTLHPISILYRTWQLYTSGPEGCVMTPLCFVIDSALLIYDPHCTPDSIWFIAYPSSKQLMLHITVLYK